MGRTFVVGDIHGAYRALRQCLERAGFDKESDTLISLGDVCDGWPETSTCIEELLSIPNLTYILGNHDYWTMEWMTSGVIDDVWFRQGGEATLQSYAAGVPPSHRLFLERALPYALVGARLFVHAGIRLHVPLHQQNLDIFLWDRELARLAMDRFLNGKAEQFTEFEEIYIGHTVVPFRQPVQSGNVWLMDTGAGWSGVLSMMNVETKEVFTSDDVPGLYPGVQGRVRRVKV